MKTIRLAAALLVPALAVIPCLVRANDEKDARQAIQARYNQFDSAYMKKDFKSVAEVFAPDCNMKLVGEGRPMKASRVVKGMVALSRSLTISHSRTRIVSLSSVGDHLEVNAVWTGESAYTSANHSKEDPSRRAKAKQVLHDTWARTDRGWQITRRIIEDSDDGQPSQEKK